VSDTKGQLLRSSTWGIVTGNHLLGSVMAASYCGLVTWGLGTSYWATYLAPCIYWGSVTGDQLMSTSYKGPVTGSQLLRASYGGRVTGVSWEPVTVAGCVGQSIGSVTGANNLGSVRSPGKLINSHIYVRLWSSKQFIQRSLWVRFYSLAIGNYAA
jgi:hypothetical protein